MEPDPIDAVDRAILYHLQRDARTAITDIADALDVADNTVRNRIQRLEDEGVIRGYQVNVDYDEADVQHHYMFVCSASVSERERLAEAARDYEGVTEVITLMTGKQNVYVIGVGAGKDDMTQLAYDLDDLGLEIEDEHLVRNHERQPFDGFRLDANV